MKDRTREWLALALAALIALVWLNQSVPLYAWRAQRAMAQTSSFEAARLPVMFLYRRAFDEEMYFAIASATLGQPYDGSIFAIRGPSPLPRMAVPIDGHFHLPYAEVPFEYPPPSLPFVLLPRLVTSTFEGYSRLLGAIMGALLVAAAALASRMATAAPRERAARLLVFSMLLLAHGAIAIQRLDAVVALLLVVVVWFARRGDDAQAGFWSGIAGAAKVVPALACLAAIAAGGALRDKRRLVRTTLAGAVGLALGLGPMLALAPSSFVLILRYHGQRGLHVESSLGVVYGAIRAAIGTREAATLDYGSFNFHGAIADTLAKDATLFTAALVGIVVYAADRAFRASTKTPRLAGVPGVPGVPDSADGADLERATEVERTTRLVLAALAGTVGLWLGGKVFSPQYLTWALPLVVALPGRSWRPIALLFGGVLLLSQLYYRGYYDAVYLQHTLGVVTMVARLVLLGTLYALLLGALFRGRGRGRTRARARDGASADEPPPAQD